ncbi:MAG: DUF308 domain-containing protein [Candidatus Aureabacteria bacterium]|nr:DUF308 domain-containing protein [Candidatus Auribacterota bacterium]
MVPMEGVSRGWLVFLGVILVIAGIAAIGMPLVASLAVELLIGWILIVSGIMQSIYSFSSRRWGKFFMRLLAGLLYFLAGIMLVAHPLRGVLTLTLLLGILFVLEGICKIIGSFQIRHVQNWGWLFFSGILALLIGILIWKGWPSSSAWAIGLLVGINILFRGWALIALALAIPSGSAGQSRAF